VSGSGTEASAASSRDREAQPFRVEIPQRDVDDRWSRPCRPGRQDDRLTNSHGTITSYGDAAHYRRTFGHPPGASITAVAIT
jgi:hypothetical protein